MIIRIKKDGNVKHMIFCGSGQLREITLSGSEVTLHEIFSGVEIQTAQGLFGISQRDSGIEVMLDGELVWSSVHGDLKEQS